MPISDLIAAALAGISLSLTVPHAASAGREAPGSVAAAQQGTSSAKGGKPQKKESKPQAKEGKPAAKGGKPASGGKQAAGGKRKAAAEKRAPSGERATGEPAAGEPAVGKPAAGEPAVAEPAIGEHAVAEPAESAASEDSSAPLPEPAQEAPREAREEPSADQPRKQREPDTAPVDRAALEAVMRDFLEHRMRTAKIERLEAIFTEAGLEGRVREASSLLDAELERFAKVLTERRAELGVETLNSAIKAMGTTGASTPSKAVAKKGKGRGRPLDRRRVAERDQMRERVEGTLARTAGFGRNTSALRRRRQP